MNLLLDILEELHIEGRGTVWIAENVSAVIKRGDKIKNQHRQVAEVVDIE